MDETKIKRINELAHKMRDPGLTPEEKEEQAALRKEYIETIRRNLRGIIENTDVTLPDGTVKPLTDFKTPKKG